MNCRTFRDNHAVFVDLQCSALEENAMREHMHACSECARHDALIRRSLMLVRNIPDIEPSADFRLRLDARLRDETPAPSRAPGRIREFRTGAIVALAAAAAFVAVVTSNVIRHPKPAEIRMAPVVATRPSTSPSPVATSAFVATVPTGMSLWPAIMVASQAPMHFVTAEMADER